MGLKGKTASTMVTGKEASTGNWKWTIQDRGESSTNREGRGANTNIGPWWLEGCPVPTEDHGERKRGQHQQGTMGKDGRPAPTGVLVGVTVESSTNK